MAGKKGSKNFGGPQSLSYWMIKKGLSEREAEEQRKIAIRTSSPQFPEYYEKLGYSITESIQLSSKHQHEASLSRKFAPTSKIEEKVFEWISKNFDPYIKKARIYDEKQKRLFFPDIMSKDYIIEIYGDYWHANPKIYEDSDIMSKGKKARQTRINDKKRITRIKTLTGLPVFILWEKDILEKGIEQALKYTLGENYEAYKKN